MSNFDLFINFVLVAFVALLAIGYVARRKRYVAARAQIMLWIGGAVLALVIVVAVVSVLMRVR